MRVACPSCSTAYEVPDRVLGTGGRMLRCARCGTEWTLSAAEPKPPPGQVAAERVLSVPPPPKPAAEEAGPPEPVSAAASPRAPPLVAVPEPALGFAGMIGQPGRPARDSGAGETAAVETRPATNAGVWLGWAGTIVLLVLLVWCGYAFRTEVMHIWPASERLYALLGMAKIVAAVPK